MPLKPNYRLLFFAGLFIVLLIGAMCARTVLASHHKPQIAFTSIKDRNAEIYVMDADGENQIRLTKHVASDRHPSWSPDGERIAFTSNRIGLNGEIHVMDSDGKNVIRLTNGEWDTNPSWSPDGQKIAFSSYRNGGNIQIFVMGSDGQNPIRLTDGVNDRNPAWSPDGQRIAFDGFGEEGLPGAVWAIQIYVMDSDGKNRKRLTNGPAHNSDPSWSPDSQRIAFVSTRHVATEIYVMNADGRKQERLTDNRVVDEDPSWSPDGQKIAFSSSLVFRGVDAREGDNEIYVMDSDGDNRRMLTDNVANDERPSWSPDGQTIAYDSWRGENPRREIHLITAEGEYLMRLSELHKKHDFHADWFDPTGRAVSLAGNQITIWGRIKRLVSNLR